MRRDVFQAIADPTRREIIEVISSQPQTVNEVAEQFNISRPAISKHLKILDECGIIAIDQKGRERYCRIVPESIIPAFVWIEQYKKLWEARIDSFEEYINQLKLKEDDSKK